MIVYGRILRRTTWDDTADDLTVQILNPTESNWIRIFFTLYLQYNQKYILPGCPFYPTDGRVLKVIAVPILVL